jgi:GNAT superfamily N-acetyltransferase
MNTENVIRDLASALSMARGQRITNELGDALLEIVQKSMIRNAAPSREFPDIGFMGRYAGSHTFHHERIADILDEIRPLHAEHWNETEGYRHGIAMKPDYPAFMAHERSGRFKLFTVRTHEGKLVGNCGVYLSRSTHHQQLVATEDTLYLLPEHRRGHLARLFVEFVQTALYGAGVREIRITVKLDRQTAKPMAAERLLSRMGYEHVANELVKVLDHVDIPALAA